MTNLVYLIQLLDDTDEEVFSHVEEELLAYGPDAIPALEDAWSQSFDHLIQSRIERIVHKIQFDTMKADLKIWTMNEPNNLLKGAILIARYQYPDLDEKFIHEQIEKIKRDVWIELNDNLTALEVVKVLNHIFFDVFNFSGNTTNYHAPQNSFLNNVLESKRGNPLSLSLLYMVVAQELHIPIYGVNLPEHFILAYLNDKEVASDDESQEKGTSAPKHIVEVLFYINAFSKGAIFSEKDIDAFLKQLKIDPEKRFYNPCSNVAIVQRMLRNLFFAYQKLGFPDKMNEIKQLLNAIHPD